MDTNEDYTDDIDKAREVAGKIVATADYWIAIGCTVKEEGDKLQLVAEFSDYGDPEALAHALAELLRQRSDVRHCVVHKMMEWEQARTGQIDCLEGQVRKFGKLFGEQGWKN